MSKEMIIEQVAKDAGITKAQAKIAYKSVLDSITNSLKRGQKITLVGFGTFLVSNRKARDGRNPRTGETMRIPASNVPRFKAGKSLKDAVR
ncbi:MAG: HU family DNA-binding protein [candidate division Zixibacteria bacterium]|nr:HU family DNA-binding protein [candidate division Zixibacteria bacterium]